MIDLKVSLKLPQNKKFTFCREKHVWSNYYETVNCKQMNFFLLMESANTNLKKIKRKENIQKCAKI